MINRLKDVVRDLGFSAYLRYIRSPLSGYSRKYQPFIIITRGRSGSTLLVERLRSHSQIVCMGEVLGTGEREVTRSAKAILETPTRAGLASVPFLERYLWRPRPDDTNAVGMKLLYPHVLERLNDEALLTRLKSAKILHLRRRNYLKSYISSIRVQETGVYAHHGEGDLEMFRCYVDPVLCEKFFGLLARTEKHTAAFFAQSDVMELVYEDMVQDLPSFDAPLCDFLGVSNQRLSHGAKKMSSGVLANQIENWDEVCEYFKNGKWASFLE